MKETIYTIPVMDAFREPCECAFCHMRHVLEQNALDFMLGPSTSYMEGDIRIKTDEIGFCRKHFGMMYALPNRLGVALMSQTHLARLRKDLSAIVQNKKPGARVKKPLFGKAAPANVSPVSAYIKKLEGTCYICDMMENTFARYIDTFFKLWPKEAELQALVTDGKGFCLPHFAMMMDAAAEKLGGADYKVFAQLACEVQMRNLERVQADIDWFVQKFDYRFQNEPWRDSKDAPRRIIQKISSEMIAEDA